MVPLGRLPRSLIPVVLFSVASAIPAAAQSEYPSFSLGIFFDLDATQHFGTVEAMSPPVSLYFLMLNLGAQISAYENSVTVSGLESEAWIIEREPVEGTDLDTAADGYIVAIGGCSGVVGGHYLISEYKFSFVAGPSAPQWTNVCAAPPTHPAPSIPGYPSYLPCPAPLGYETGSLAPIPIQWIPDGCAVINPHIVPVESRSWAAVKSEF